MGNPTSRQPMKLATWNVNSLAVRLPQLLDWLSAHQPDAMVLQETKLTDDKHERLKALAKSNSISINKLMVGLAEGARVCAGHVPGTNLILRTRVGP